MDKDLSDYRKTYQKNALSEKNSPASPLELFSSWFEAVEENKGVEEINAMTLTTLGLDGFPKARVVLLKSYDSKGFVFYTNYTSDKGKALDDNNKACISFFWPPLERQVIIKGIVKKVSESQSISYFNSRPRGSQLGAWVSDQSSVISSRDVLEEELSVLEKKYKGREIPKPHFWGGYILQPVEFEFWQGRPNRLHDRIRYSKNGKNWKIQRLAP